MRHVAISYHIPIPFVFFDFLSKYRSKMSAATKKSQCEAILFLWNEGVRTAKEIQARTNISLSTIYDNIEKLKKTGTVDHAKGNGRPKKITETARRAIGQYVRKDSSIPTRTMAVKLATKGIEVSHSTVSRHLASTGYLNSLPRKVPMLTDAHKQARVEWARKHLNDNWERTFFQMKRPFSFSRTR